MCSFTRAETIGKRFGQRPPSFWPHLIFGVVLMLSASCTPILVSDPSPPAEPEYGRIIASYFRQTFKGLLPNSSDPSPYTNFEISGLRWVHARTGWNWLVCTRFDQRGTRRTFAFYIQNKPKDASQSFETTTTGKLTPAEIEQMNRLKSANLQVQDAAKFVAEARYATVIDDCDSQNFLPFDVATGAIGTAGTTSEAIPPQLQPIH
jgi:hypothetical protein